MKLHFWISLAKTWIQIKFSKFKIAANFFINVCWVGLKNTSLTILEVLGLLIQILWSNYENPKNGSNMAAIKILSTQLFWGRWFWFFHFKMTDQRWQLNFSKRHWIVWIILPGIFGPIVLKIYRQKSPPNCHIDPVILTYSPLPCP